jgi:hypothetical protein
MPTDVGATCNSLRRWDDAEHALTHALALDPHYALAADFLARTYVNSTGDIRGAKQAYQGVPAESKTPPAPATGWAGVSSMIDERVYLDVLERHFADALKAWDTPPNTPEARLRQLEARIGIQVIAGQSEAAKSECEQARALLEARLIERPEDRASMLALAWLTFAWDGTPKQSALRNKPQSPCRLKKMRLPVALPLAGWPRSKRTLAMPKRR